MNLPPASQARAPVTSEAPLHPGMVWVPGGTFMMGSDHHYAEEAPAHRVTVDGFWIDQYTVTNRDFAVFVKATGHLTVAERTVDPADYPGVRPDMLQPASTVFVKPQRRVDLADPYLWWTYVPGANWRHPQGPSSSVKRRPDHPAVHLAWEDAAAYADWAGKQLPSEAEWEFAARGGLEAAVFCWGDDPAPRGRMMANTWQGEFPWQNLLLDRFEGTSPVNHFPPNGYGLHDMAGNVWEWTADAFAPTDAGQGAQPCCGPEHPRAMSTGGAGSGDQFPRFVIKGGSHLCAPNYCLRYRPAARQAESADTTTSHVGFRCIQRPHRAG